VVERLPAGVPRATPPEGRLARPGPPADPAAAARLALGWVELGHAEADLRYYGYAQAALAPWWELPDPPSALRLPRALILQARHAFDAALTDLDALVAREPRNAQAWLTRAGVLQAQGRPRLALASCAHLTGLVPALVSTACAAAAAGRLGWGEAALRRLEGVLAEEAADAEPPVLLWVLGIQAELAAGLGHAGVAEAALRAALGLNPRDPRTLAAYADLLLDQGRPGEVRDLLAPRAGALSLRLRLAVAERRLGGADFALGLAALRSDLQVAGWRGEDLHLREAARAHLELLDDPATALELAARNWSRQREPADARVLLECALAAGAPRAAAPVLAWLADAGVADHRLDALVARLEGRPRAGS
jgi:hypothetical protein